MSLRAQVMLVWLCFVWSKAYLRGFEDCDVALTVWGYVLYTAMLLNFAKSTSCGQRAVGALCVPWVVWDLDHLDQKNGMNIIESNEHNVSFWV
jgi:hypothetical protein